MKQNLKSMVALAVFVASNLLAACGEPEQKFEVKVMDETNKSMEGVEVTAWFNRKGESSPLDSYKVIGTTDAAGFVELQGETTWYQTSVSAEPAGFYKSMKYGHWTVKRKDNRWEPWPVEVGLVLKKIRNPQPMYVAKFDGQKWVNFPDQKLGPFGFDLMVGDWVQPHGAGKIVDFIIRAVKDNPTDTSLTPKSHTFVTFRNQGDGIIKMIDEGGSNLVGPSVAPENGYQDIWDFPNWRPHDTQEKMTSQDFSNEAYVFRVRTILDSNRNVISAHYGKIDGRIISWLPQKAATMKLTYYLNGKENDRGLEWDLKKNLIQDTSRFRIPERP